MEYLRAWGTLIHEKKLEVENLVSDSLWVLRQYQPKNNPDRRNKCCEDISALSILIFRGLSFYDAYCKFETAKKHAF